MDGMRFAGVFARAWSAGDEPWVWPFSHRRGRVRQDSDDMDGWLLPRQKRTPSSGADGSDSSNVHPVFVGGRVCKRATHCIPLRRMYDGGSAGISERQIVPKSYWN